MVYNSVCLSGSVAPRAGAWIETMFNGSEVSVTSLSRPVRARGLKLAGMEGKNPAGASRPVRARGLKPLAADQEHIARFGRAPCGRVD